MTSKRCIAGLCPGTLAADERVFQFRHFPLHHLHPGRRHHLLSARFVLRRRRLHRAGLAHRLPIFARCGCRHGQIASAFPTAGGLYHWASILGGRGWGWTTAWFNLIGLVSVLAAINVGARIHRQHGAAPIRPVSPSSFGSGAMGHQDLLGGPGTLSQALFNHLGIRIVSWLTDFSGYLILVVSLALTGAALLEQKPRFFPTRDFHQF